MLRIQERERRLRIERELQVAGLPVYVKLDAPGSQKGGGRGGGGVGFGPVHVTRHVLNEKGLEEWKKQQEGGEKQSEVLSNITPQSTKVDGANEDFQRVVVDEKKGSIGGDSTIAPSQQHGSGEVDPEAETYVQFRRRITLEEKKEFITKVK